MDTKMPCADTKTPCGTDNAAERVYLDEDVIKVPGQNYVIVSFVSPDGNQRSDRSGIKIRGVFDTRGEAEEHVRRLMQVDGSFDVYVADMYRWLVVPPRPEDVDAVYTNDYLNELITGHKEAQEKARIFFERRVKEEAAARIAADATEAESSPEVSPSGVAAAMEADPPRTKAMSWADEVDDAAECSEGLARNVI